MEAKDNTIVEHLFGITIQYYARGFVIHVTGQNWKHFNGMVFTYNESRFLEHLLHTIITSYFKPHNGIQQATLISCPYCSNYSMEYRNNQWYCTQCGYKIKHYGEIANDKK